MTRRLRHQVLTSGQPRPYAAHERIVRVQLVDSNDKPVAVTREELVEWLKDASIGFTDYVYKYKEGENTGDYFRPQLKYLKRVRPDQEVWEFKVIDPYTG